METCRRLLCASFGGAVGALLVLTTSFKPASFRLEIPPLPTMPGCGKEEQFGAGPSPRNVPWLPRP